MALVPLRRTARRALNLADRILHPLRRRAVLDRLHADPPRSVLFVCHGNICRSPFAAELALLQLAGRNGAGIAVASAGILEPGRPCPVEAMAAARQHGVDLTMHRSRNLSPALVASADLVVVMDTGQREHVCAVYRRRRRDVVLLGDFDPRPDAGRTLIDPVDRPRDVFDACYDRIQRCVLTLTTAAAPAPAPL